MSGPRRIARAVRHVLAAALYFSGAVGLLRRLRPRNAGPLIIRYHSIGGGPALRPPLVVSERHFASHVRYLRRAYATVSLDALIALLETGQPAPRGSVAITFDDGYCDNHDIALPILRRYDCPATVFVVVESARTGEPPWPQRLYGLLRSAARPEVRLSCGSSPLRQRPNGCFDLRTPAARDAAYRDLKAIIATLDAEERLALLRQIAQATGDGGPAPAETVPFMLSGPQLRAMARRGVTIGSHTMTHPRLSSLDRDRAERELVESRVALESVLGLEVRLFAYPFGTASDFNAEIQQAVVRAGYRAACTTVEGSTGPDADPFALRRLKMRDEPVWMFAARLLAAEHRSRLLAWVVGE